MRINEIYIHILRVIKSCKNLDQLYLVERWAIKAFIRSIPEKKGYKLNLLMSCGEYEAYKNRMKFQDDIKEYIKQKYKVLGR